MNASQLANATTEELLSVAGHDPHPLVRELALRLQTEISTNERLTALQRDMQSLALELVSHCDIAQARYSRHCRSGGRGDAG